MTTPEITASEVALLATKASKAEIEEAAGRISRETPHLLPLYLHRFDEALSLIHQARRAIITEMVAGGWLGEHKEGTDWTSPEGQAFRFEEGQRTEFSDIEGLFVLLTQAHRITAGEIGRCVSGLRVTDLRALADARSNEERAQILELIEDHRTRKPSTPGLVWLDNPYRRRASESVLGPSRTGGPVRPPSAASAPGGDTMEESDGQG